MITLDNYHKLKQVMPVISQQIDMKATGANIHKLRNHLCILDGCIQLLAKNHNVNHWITVANRTRKDLDNMGIHFSI